MAAEGRLSGRKVLVTCICLVQVYIALGLIYGFSVMYADIINVFSTSRLNSAFIQGTFNLVALGGGIMWTWPIRRIGIGPSMVVGALVGCFGFVASSFARNFQTIIVCTGVICGTGISIGFLAPFVIIGLIYSEDPGFPLTLLTVSGSLGQMTMPLVYEAFLTNYHWSGAFILLGCIALQGVPVGVLCYTSDRLVSKSDEDMSSSSSAVCDTKVLTDIVVWFFVVTVAVLFGTVNFELWFLVDQMISLGYTQNLGTVLLSVLGFANLVGRIVGSVLKLRCRAFPAVYNMFYVCPLIALGHTLIITLQTQDHLMIAACIVHGLGFGILNAMAPVMMYDLVEGDKFMHAVGLLNFSFGIGNLLSNFIGGRIRDVSGSYDLAYEIGIAASLLVTIDFVVIARITKKRQKERKSLLLPDDLKIIPYKTIN